MNSTSVHTRLGLALSATICAFGALACGHHRPVRPGVPALVEDELPIRRVILYQNGVGYFERAGEIDGDAITLHCRPHQINDLLKSLTVIDRGTGRPVSVSLPLEKSGARVLSQLPRQVRNASGLLDVLRVFRGARVSVQGGQGEASGRVVGVEEGLVATSGKDPVKGWRLTLKTDDGRLVIYPVNAIRYVSMKDRALEVGLERSLDVSLDSGAWKPVALTIRLAGGDTHEVAVSYIVEMPNWKPAYRLVVPPNKSGRQPLLQGWAVVDNVSGESWHGVQLSLVAGTPMSFVYDLHTPRFTRRVDLTPRSVRTALAPTREAVGYDEDQADSSPSAIAATAAEASPRDMLQRSYGASRAGAGAATRKPSKRAPRPAYKSNRKHRRTMSKKFADVLNVALENQAPSNVSGAKVAGLFRYDLGDPVTVPDSSSTLVNIVNARVDGGEVVLFRPELTSGFGASHPYRAARFTNTTGFALEKGPVAIYSRGTFVGEGFLERMEKGTTTFLTFAVDGNVSMKRSSGSGQEVVKLLRISGGRILSEVLQISRKKFRVTNHHEKAITAYFKTRSPGSSYKLRTDHAGIVKAGDVTYVPVNVPANDKATLEIEWVTPVKRWLAVDTSMAQTVLKLFASSGRVPAAVKPVLDQIVAAQARLSEIDGEIARIERLKRELSSDQERVRNNLNLLRKVKGNAALRGRLTRSLAELETKLSRLTARFVRLDEEKARLRGTIQALIGQIKLDAAQP
jgi:hypothetical protein